MSLAATDKTFLDHAVALAAPLLGTTAENPTVGALVVDQVSSEMLGQGVTAPGGRPHAEPQALAMAGERAYGATLYVTLEPCNHWGRTPPCVDAVIASGVVRVVVGICDPDPRTAGQGIERLRAAGIAVVLADHAPSHRLHEGFVMRQKLGRPFVTLKLAVSADGMIGLPDRGNVPITGEAARHWTHVQRAHSDAVMVGAATARLDDPQLTVRIPGLEQRTPKRVVLAGRTPLPALTLFTKASPYPVVVIAAFDGVESFPQGVEVLRVAGADGRPELTAALQALGARGIGLLLVEGGAVLSEALLAAGLVDRFQLLAGAGIVGPDGVPASTHGRLEARLAAAGFSQVDQQALGVDNLRTFERR